MNNLFNLTYEAGAANLDAPIVAHADGAAGASLAGLLLEEPFAEPQGDVVVTDEEAEMLLPGYAIAFEEYHQHRSEGASPDEALQLTMQQWRTFWTAAAYVPHRR